jgi:branched-chain amino acid transport system substrate-binding protein
MLKILMRLLAVALLAPAAVAQNAPIVVHHIGPFTGVLASSNKEAIAGTNLFLEGLNAGGGVQGRPVQLQTLDDGQDPKRAKALFDELQATKKLLALLLTRTTPSLDAMLPGIAQHGIPLIGPQTGASVVNQPPRREVFTLRASYRKEAEQAIRLQHGIGVRSFGLLLADDSFGADTMVAIDSTFKELGLNPVGMAKIDNRKPDVSAAIRTLLDHSPQVVLLIVSSKAASDFVKGYRAQGGSATFISLSNTSSHDYIQGLGNQARGAIVMQVLPSPFSATTALAREYAAAAGRKHLPLSYAGLYGYATGKLLAMGLAKAGREPTPASLVAAMESLGEVDLGGFRVRYGPGERTGSSYVDSAIITSGGRFMR